MQYVSDIIESKTILHVLFVASTTNAPWNMPLIFNPSTAQLFVNIFRSFEAGITSKFSKLQINEKLFIFIIYKK